MISLCITHTTKENNIFLKDSWLCVAFSFFFLEHCLLWEEVHDVSFVFLMKQTGRIISLKLVLSGLYADSLAVDQCFHCSLVCRVLFTHWHFPLAVFPVEGSVWYLPQQMRFVWTLHIFASPVALRARCWFPFSPCSLNMPWPGFPHVVRMIHHYGLHRSFIYLLLIFLPSVFPSHSLSPSK